MRYLAKDEDAANSLRKNGVEARTADYSRPQALANAFASVDLHLLISRSENGKRKIRHRSGIDAAKDVDGGLIADTRILHPDTSPLFLAEEHRDTKAALAETGVLFVLLRNGWCTEVYAWRPPLALKHGVITGAAGDGGISFAACADYARAAATVLAGGDHTGRVCELAGDAYFTLAGLAAVVAKASGRPMAYEYLTREALRLTVLDASILEMVTRILSDADADADADADVDAGVAKGVLSIGHVRLSSRARGFPSMQ